MPRADRPRKTCQTLKSRACATQLPASFVQGPGTKRIKIMGRGRTGLSFIRKSHLKLTLTEIDFDLAIATAGTANQKAKWTKRRDAVNVGL